jgi:hypothetical protein|tara:strand:+ start:323 stop:1573 length:1251 start_codon:yes stop_codon:yes gene_type:complete
MARAGKIKRPYKAFRGNLESGWILVVAPFRGIVLVSAAAFLLAACSFAEDALWPSLTGEAPSGSGEEVYIPASQEEIRDEASYAETAAPVSPRPITQASYEPDTALTASSPTGTFVGAKVAQQRSELENLKSSVNNRRIQFEQVRNTARQNSQGYFATIAAVTARLRIGTTPGNPVLVSQWNAAQSELDRILTDIAALNTLGNQVAADSAMSSYLLDSVRATFGLQGAVDEDHRQLAVIEDEVNRNVVLIDRLLGGLRETIGRYTNYVNAERRNLSTLALAIKNGEYLGPSLANQGDNYSSGPVRSAAVEPQSLVDERRPLVVIRFDRANVEFKQALYTAISTALERRPQSTFDLVAVAPNMGSPANVALATNASKRHAETVLQALGEMGLPSNRVTLSSTTSPGVQTNEVHIYVR